MPRTRGLAVAAGFGLVLIFGAVFVAEIRAVIVAAFPDQARTILGGIVIAAIGAAVVIAASRIGTPGRGATRERRALRYLALTGALAAGVLVARGLRTGDADIDLVESFHFVEYGFLTLLFYRAWRPIGDLSVLVLPVLAGLLVGTVDEWLQWFVPSRVGEFRDVVLNGVAVACGLLFSVGSIPPEHFTFALRPGSARRIGSTAIIATIVVALFFHTVHLGYDVRDDEMGTFRSRYTRLQLDSAARERMHRQREEAPPVPGRLSREDQYVSEGLWHVRRRNQAWAAGDIPTAWRENRILETFFVPVLDGDRAGLAWPAEQRAQAARVAAGDDRPFVSDAAPVPIYDWPKSTFWLMIALAIAVILAIAISASKRERPGR